MKYNIKTIGLNIVFFILTTVASFILCYYYLDNWFIIIPLNLFGAVSFRLFVSFVLFLSFKWIFNKNIKMLEKKILFGFYFLFILGISLGRMTFPHITYDVNWHLWRFEDYSKYIFLLNIFMYFPIGLFIKKIFSLSSIKYIFIFIIYIFIIEMLQYKLNVGYFDINDIILNSIGFILGLLFYPILKNHFLRH